jgi:murein DD-endopeptidase MepM/ murein hydrolase activator NlpD
VRANLEFGRAGNAAQAAPRAGIRPWLFYLTFAALFGTNVATAVGLVMAPDIAGLLNGQNDLVLSAYEDRIAQLRVEVDRLHSRQYAQAGDINLRMQDLAQQQDLLIEQHQYVKALADKAAELGLATATIAPSEDAALLTSAVAPGDAGTTVDQAADSVGEMMLESRLALAAISQSATAETNEILAELSGLGIRPDLPDDTANGVGGPFLPATDGPETMSLVDDANSVMAALVRFKAARAAIDLAPIHFPIAGDFRMSSNFGNRTDPFTGKKAYHAGIDYPAPSGTIVLSAGAGTVVFVGQRSGYGNVVEVEHQDGILTRYAHLSAFLVKEGQSVATGSPIAKVGSTGRSTGPHLHFEVRRNDTAIDPGTFINTGQRLQRFVAVI